MGKPTLLFAEMQRTRCTIHWLDRVVRIGRLHQSTHTQLVHLFEGKSHRETIPVFENFCFAFALIRQKTLDTVNEGKKILERLYAFQAPADSSWSGNFPVYIHEFPRCYDSLQPLWLSPILQMLLHQYRSILNDEFKKKTQLVLDRLLVAASSRREEKPFLPLWERRYHALFNRSMPVTDISSASEWSEELLTSYLLGEPLDDLLRWVHPQMGVYVGPSAQEEQYQNEPYVLPWFQLTSQSPVQQLQAALVDPGDFSGFSEAVLNNWKMIQKENEATSFALHSSSGSDRIALRMIWQGTDCLHSLVVTTGTSSVYTQPVNDGMKVSFELPEIDEIAHNELFEVSVFCNISDETEVTIDQKKFTYFDLDQEILIQTPQKEVRLKFSVEEGEGKFCGHLCRSNRPFQMQENGMDREDTSFQQSYDWRIGVRTLRRTKLTKLGLHINHVQHQER